MRKNNLTLLSLSNGNPGALSFLIELMDDNNLEIAIPIITKLELCTTIRGTNLYILYSDLCNKDLMRVYTLCLNCPCDILEDACSRQDYSGRELVKNYFHTNNTMQ